MEQLLSSLPAWVTTFGALTSFIIFVILGILAVIGLTDKQVKQNQKNKINEADGLEDKIKKLYQEAALAQDDKIKEQTIEIDAMKKRLSSLELENTIFRGIITGTDEATKAYRSRVDASLTLVDKLAEVIILNGKKSDKILEGIVSVEKSLFAITKAMSETKSDKR